MSSAESGSGFEGLFNGPVEVRSVPVEMSFEVKDGERKRLRELEFEFDQLVRQ